MNLIGCSKTKPKIDTSEIRVFWGTKEECISTLQNSRAIAKRWLIEAIGD
jgi:hypothetical protein